MIAALDQPLYATPAIQQVTMATEHAHPHQQLAGDSAHQPFSGEKSFGRWRHLVGGLASSPVHQACIDQEPGDDGPASTHAMMPVRRLYRENWSPLKFAIGGSLSVSSSGRWRAVNQCAWPVIRQQSLHARRCTSRSFTPYILITDRRQRLKIIARTNLNILRGQFTRILYTGFTDYSGALVQTAFLLSFTVVCVYPN